MQRKRSFWGLIPIFITILSLTGINAQTVNIQHLQNGDNYEIYLPFVKKSTPVPPSPTPPTPVPSVTVLPPTGARTINHNSLSLYNQIPTQYLRAAEQIKFTFIDRSVGQNINDGLTCLSAASWIQSPAHCRRDYTNPNLSESKTFTNNDPVIPALIQFPGGNNRSNINFVMYGETWETDLATFISQYPANAHLDIFTYQHNYLHVAAGSNIASAYFDPNYSGTNIYDLMALEARYPNKTFVYWTTSLARNIGTAEAQSFNNQMRTWAAQNGKFLLDVAAIESHAPDGTPCRNAQGYEILCPHYTTETDGGHLGSVSGGKIRIAKAIWVMLAQIAGWRP